ncbi:hypothetical protein RIR_jg28265.t1 [Rhizophagus irregularis DAOM 181602=DAOM 197198]|uniref:Uncharacterized protein n=1 Tax=Rhizophagus irregularis (strain DAOM 181602 / DAOM 197198 / MUCL 43194) TaxID=747089 RepID=U9UC32_RHIID|nr:hypothetical protein RIR_jg28265.t1 [Rhizophagus irregularis DAOM 181602=DAOM 197198]
MAEIKLRQDVTPLNKALWGIEDYFIYSYCYLARISEPVTVVNKDENLQAKAQAYCMVIEETQQMEDASQSGDRGK